MYECQRVECAFTSPERAECGMFVMCCMHRVMYRVICFIVRGCAVSRRYIHFCNCDLFSVVNVYHDHLKFYAVCIDGRDGMSVVVNVMLVWGMDEMWIW